MRLKIVDEKLYPKFNICYNSIFVNLLNKPRDMFLFLSIVWL